MKLHELEILHEDLIDITIGKKTFVLTENNKNYQEGKYFVQLKSQIKEIKK